MGAADVLGLLQAFDAAGVRVWIDGGWGVDALVGDRLRAHDDLDIVVAIEDVPSVWLAGNSGRCRTSHRQQKCGHCNPMR